jgi:hypothetical protein
LSLGERAGFGAVGLLVVGASGLLIAGALFVLWALFTS